MSTTTQPFFRDPLYGSVPLDPVAAQLVATPEFQRLRAIRQLSMASMVYPSAMHTRFEHALGVYHLSGRILRHLDAMGDLAEISPDDQRLVRYAALLHDLGHFSGAHLLEEIGYPGADHEHAGADHFTRGDVGKILRATRIPQAERRVGDIITHQSDHPLAGIVAGDVDADKLDYLWRDAYHCGLPAVFDQPQLIYGLRLVVDPETGRRQLGLAADALQAFEAMLYAKYSLYRNVYFHGEVRAATAMMRGLLVAALDAQLLTMQELHFWTDDQVYTLLLNRVGKKRNQDARQVRRLCDRLQAGRLYTTATSVPIDTLPPTGLAPGVLSRLERRMEELLGLQPGEVLLDVPRKPTMFSTDLLVQQPDGQVLHMRDLGPADGLALPASRPAFYTASGRIHCFTAEPQQVDPAILRALLLDEIPSATGAAAPAPMPEPAEAVRDEEREVAAGTPAS